MLILRKGKLPLAAWSVAAVLLVAPVITPSEALESINVNVLGIFIGTMILASFLIYSDDGNHGCLKFHF